jgi:calcium-dependent protein kinase
VLKGEYTLDEPEWQDVSMDAKEFIKKLLEYDSNKRISPQEALQHPWIKN